MSAAAQKLFAVTHVAGFQVPAITPTDYRVHFREYTEGNPNFDRLEWHSQFNVGCCSGCACCIPWCCVFPRCSTEKNVHDYIEQLPDDKNGNAVFSLAWTEAFGCCGVCCGCEKGKHFTMIDPTGQNPTFIADGEVFVFSKSPVIAKTDQDTITAAIIAGGFREAGFTLEWY